MRKDFLAAAILTLCVWALHGHGLSLDFWLDDHNHLELCRENGYSRLHEGNRFDWNNRITHVWWAKEETGWAYFRPLTVTIRVTMLRLFGLDPLPFHIVHLTLFNLSVLLFYALLRHCGWGIVSALMTNLFFVLHPANSFTTPWIANDGPVLVGLFLCAGAWFMHLSALAGHRRPGPLMGIFACYALAMLSRENGIMVGPLLLLFDLAGAGRPRAPADADVAVPQATWGIRLAVYAGMALEGLIYLAVRTSLMTGAPLPRNPYFHLPTEPGFVSWWSHKVLIELLSLPLGLPLVPIVDVPWWQARPVATALALVTTAILAVAVIYPLRRSRSSWILLAGICLAQAPTALIFTAAYNYYLATAGCALLFTLWARRLVPDHPRLVAGTAVALSVWYFAGLWSGSWMMHSVATAERKLRTEVLATRLNAAPPHTRLFFINMPFFAAESGPALRNALDRSDLDVYPLTYAPELFVPGPVAVEQEDDNTILICAGERSFFSGPFGTQVHLAWYGATRQDLRPGPVVPHAHAGPLPYRVEIVQMDDAGVKALRFVFEKPLADATHRFYLGSPFALAQRLRFHHSSDSAENGFENTLDDSPRDLARLKRAQSASQRVFGLLERLP
jgi:hypothetical protein